MEGADLNDFFSQFIAPTSADTTSRIKVRTASFCTERSGYYDGGGNDQGLSFYLPNGTWLQPPGYVHKMLHDTWLPNALAVSVTGSATLSVSAQMAEDRSALRLIIVNNQTRAITTSVILDGWLAGVRANVTTLSAPSLGVDNPPGRPDLISPQQSNLSWGGNGNGNGDGDGARGRTARSQQGRVNFPPLSISVVVFQAAA
jgi:hypothetical protein